MGKMKDNFVQLCVAPEVAQKHVELVNAGLQTKVRAIMAIYDCPREIAEQILFEINQEQSGDSVKFTDFVDEIASLND